MTPTHPAGRHLALVGPTASGKSAVGLALAVERIRDGRPTEVLSCDSMQVYRGMDIGTAKPTAQEQAAVPHHMIDVVEPTEEHNLTLFLRGAREALAGIESRGADALLLGGTGLYVQALVDGFEPPPQFPEIVAELDAEADTEVLTARLEALDPVALERIPAGSRRRVLRALEVTIGSGRPFSEHGERLDAYPPTPFVLCGLRPCREDLAARIDARYEAQMEAGFGEEVVLLHELGEQLSRTAAQALGYRELLAAMAGDGDLEAALALARIRTRRFAVRQLRWFGRDPRITWFDAPSDGEEVEVLARRIDRLWRKSAVDGIGSVATVGPGSPGGPGSEEEP